MNTFTKCTLAFASAFALAAFPTASEAQVSVEVRGGLQMPTGDFGDVADSDAGFGGDIFFNVNPRVSIYGGYGLENFGDDISSKGFEAGAKFILASRQEGVLPWARVGGVLHELEFGSADSDRAFGFQASVGGDIPLGEVLSFSPALRYQTYSPEFDGVVVPGAPESVSFFSLDFGLHIHPGG